MRMLKPAIIPVQSSPLHLLLDEGKFDDDEEALTILPPEDHTEYVAHHSSSRLVHYVAGYVARKARQKTGCRICTEHLTISKASAVSDTQTEFIRQFDRGGLLYPSSGLAQLVGTLEESFTVFFSSRKIEAASMCDFAAFLQNVEISTLGCSNHAKDLTLVIVKFYVLLRFRFYAKSLNQDRSTKRDQKKHLKMRRCK